MNNDVGRHCSQDPRQHPDAATEDVDDTEQRWAGWASQGCLFPCQVLRAMWVTWTPSTSTGQTKDGRIKAIQFRPYVCSRTALSHRWQVVGGTGGGLGGTQRWPVCYATARKSVMGK